MALLIPFIPSQYFDGNGAPLSGGKIQSYEAGTTTPKDTFTDQSGTVANANPVILDANGRAQIWLDDGSYKFVIMDSADNIIDTIDNVVAVDNTPYIASIQSVSTNTNIDSTFENDHVNCTSSVTLSLLSAATAGDGFTFSVRNSSTGAVTLSPAGVETINGASSLVLSPGESGLIVSDGSNWFGVFIQQPSLHLDRTGDYTILAGDQGKLLLVDASSGDVTISLPPVATSVDGFELTVKKVDSSSNTVTIDANSTELIDANETFVLYKQYEFFSVKNDQLKWHIINWDPPRPTVDAKTADYTVLNADEGKVIDCDASSAAFTVTLPAAADVPNGFKITVKKTDSSVNAVTIDADSSETIDGDETLLLNTQDDAITLIADGSEWFTISDRLKRNELTSQNASGSEVDFAIPAGAKKVVFALDAVSASGASSLDLRIGDSGGIETSGYTGGYGQFDDSTNQESSPNSVEFGLTGSYASAANTATGVVVLERMSKSSNKWALYSNIYMSGQRMNSSSGIRSLDSELTTVRFFVASGSFDAGSIDCVWE